MCVCVCVEVDRCAQPFYCGDYQRCVRHSAAVYECVCQPGYVIVSGNCVGLSLLAVTFTLYVCLSLSLCLSVSVCLSVCLSVSLSLSLSLSLCHASLSANLLQFCAFIVVILVVLVVVVAVVVFVVAVAISPECQCSAV